MIAPVLFLVATLQASPVQGTRAPSVSSGREPVEGVLVVTGDSSVVKSVRKAEFSTAADLVRLFPSARYETVLWNDKYRLVIDRTTGPLGGIADRTLIERVFTQSPDKSGVLDLAAMTPETYGAVKAWVGEWPSTGRPSVRQEPVALGAHVEHYMVLKAGNESHRFSYRTPDSHQESMFAALRRKALGGSPSSQGRLSSDMRKAVPPPRDEYDFVYVGVSGADRTEGLRLAAESIKTIEARMRRESELAAQDLLRSLGYHVDPNLPGTSEASRMTREMRNQIADQLKIGWGHMGFGSQAEAMDFLDQASSFEIRTTLSMYQTIDPGDPDHMVPSSGIQWQIQDVPGAYLP